MLRQPLPPGYLWSSYTSGFFGLVVKVSAMRVADLGFVPAFVVDFFSRLSHTSDLKNLYTRCLALYGQSWDWSSGVSVM